MKILRKIAVFGIILLLFFTCNNIGFTQQQQGINVPLPGVNVELKPMNYSDPGQVSVALQILIILGVLSLAPAFIMMVTAFIRISIVLSFTRTALSTQQLPPNQILMGLALFLTFFIMYPTFEQVYNNALKPFQENKISSEQLYERGIEPIRTFMFKQMNKDDASTMKMFLSMAKIKMDTVKSKDDIPTYILVPSFILCELRKSFIIGVLIFVPFIIIDIIVASVLLSMGIIFLPPVIVSLPFKIILFILVDGWNLLVRKLIEGFNL